MGNFDEEWNTGMVLKYIQTHLTLFFFTLLTFIDFVFFTNWRFKTSGAEVTADVVIITIEVKLEVESEIIMGSHDKTRTDQELLLKDE